jgi:hypothetical protein
MAFFNVTDNDGKPISVNTDTIKYCEAYDHAAMRAQLLESEKRHNAGSVINDRVEPVGVSKELKATFERITSFQSMIYFTDGTRRAAMETPDKIRQLANIAVAEVMGLARTAEARPAFSFSTTAFPSVVRPPPPPHRLPE